MSHVVIIGCGVVGAAIAYELSLKGLQITVFDKQLPAQASTGAALGVLMGIISHKIKGRAWKLRQHSIQRYHTLIPELEAIINRQIPCNTQGILSLCLEGEDMAKWRNLQEIRHSQGWELEIWDRGKLQKLCPQIDVNNQNITGAIYSPQDRQIDPTALTLALVEAAQHHGVTFKFGVEVVGMEPHQIQTTQGTVPADWFVVSAGLGSSFLTAQLPQKLDIRPVLGQALHLQVGHTLGNPDFQPAITGNDVHIVPVGQGEYWIGATVEFPIGSDNLPPDEKLLLAMLEQAQAFCPQLASATITRTWQGLRPRPEGQPAPVIEKSGTNILLATGHYRNGVLLAPATADAIREMIIG